MPGIQSTYDRWLEAPYQEGLWFDCSECNKRVDEGNDEGVCPECLEAGEEEEDE